MKYQKKIGPKISHQWRNNAIGATVGQSTQEVLFFYHMFD